MPTTTPVLASSCDGAPPQSVPGGPYTSKRAHDAAIVVAEVLETFRRGLKEFSYGDIETAVIHLRRAPRLGRVS